MLTELLAEGRNESAIQYREVLTREGNTKAFDTMMAAFEEEDGDWRGSIIRI